MFRYNFITLYGVIPSANIKYVENMKRLPHILLSALSFGGMSCVPLIEEEVDMYAAPYTEFRPSQRVADEAEAEVDKMQTTEVVDAPNI